MFRELRVDLRVELVPHYEVRRGTRKRNDNGDDPGRDKRQAAAEAHGSRST